VTGQVRRSDDFFLPAGNLP